MAPPPFGSPATSLLERPLGFAPPPRDGVAFLAAPECLRVSTGGVAGPGLGGGQVTVLRLHAAVCWLRNDCTILAERSERITQLQYLLHLSLRTSENRQCEVRRIHIPRTRVNKGKRKGRGSNAPALGLMDSLLCYVTSSSWQPPPVVFPVVVP
jgi:hypothetical protein